MSGKVFTFDLETGAIAEKRPEHAAADKAIAVAVEKVATTLERPHDYRVIRVQQAVVRGRYIWSVTFKPTRLLPADPSTDEIGAGGEIFVNVDVQTDSSQVLRGE